MITDYGSTLDKLEQRVAELETFICARTLPLGSFKRHVGEITSAAAPSLDDSAWEDFRVGQGWGGDARRTWFRLKLVLPDWFIPGQTSLRLIPGGDRGGGGLAGFETLVYLDGVEAQAIDPRHLELLLPASWRAGETHLVAIHAYCGTYPGWKTWEVRQLLAASPDMDPNPAFREQVWQKADLCLIDPLAEQLYFDASAALDVIRLLEVDDYRRIAMTNALDNAFRLLDWRAPGSSAFRASVAQAAESLRKNLYESMDAGQAPTVIGTGHAHIDVAWLWPLQVTREKAARTFATALHLMEQYPDYVFTQSQTQLYKFVKEDHPALYERIKRKVADGQWAATGAMWVEADCNISSGESLVRQILFGKRFFRQELGVNTRLLWLPDVFGYSAALPQILKRSGVDYFMTTKISWNQFNRVPVDTFHWQGIDGTEVLTHFVTTPSDHSWWATYNGLVSARDIKATWDLYQQKRINDEVLTSFGYGDGGGGPTKEMLERAKRFANMPAMPRVKLGHPDAFFDRLAQRVANTAPKWVGELYLEYHRGTYTTQARNKRANRKSELLYRDAELFAAAATALLGRPYPRQALNQGWELILLNQFHDIIPGSSINEVYRESLQQYAQLRQSGERVRDEALRALAGEVNSSAGSILVFNSASWPRRDLVRVELPASAPAAFQLIAPNESSLPYQIVESRGRRELLFAAQGVPPCGWHAYRLQPLSQPPAASSPLRVTPGEIETPFWRIRLNAAGQITSLWDNKAGREVVAPGEAANRFLAFEDKPLRFDAWDIDIFYQEKEWAADDPAEIVVLEQGPVRGQVQVKRRFLDSTIAQRITVYADTPRIDFETEVDWQERQTLLKVAFPVAVHSPRATYEIQYGNVERPTHWNTSWDWARFETCAHKWADLSEGGYGVSLLNDCKYGHDIRGHTMRLTLLKSPLLPDPRADAGHHEFTYSLYPHQGDWRQGTIPAAYELNVPLLAMAKGNAGGSLPASHALVQVEGEGVIVEAVKMAEDSDELVVRAYECHNHRGPVALRFGLPIREAWECNLLEEERAPMSVADDALRFDIAPYEIRTFILRVG